jgi:hypothetical protein
MSASKQCKALGIKSLSHACRVAGVPRTTANDWYRRKPKLFVVFINGVRAIDNGGDIR